MKHWSCDVCGEKRLLPSEVTTLAVRGPLRSAAIRAELHACKMCMHPIAKLFNIPLAPPPDYLDGDLRARRQAEADPLAADATAADIRRQEILARGTAAGTRPPKGRRKPA